MAVWTKLAFRAVAIVFAASAQVAAHAATVAISGVDVFTLADCTNTTIALRFTADAEPLALRTNNVAAADGSAVSWTIEWDKPQVSNVDIREYRSVGTIGGGCPDAGRFAVPMTLSLAGTPASTAPLSLTLVRTAKPVLDAPGAVTIPVTLWPWSAWFHGNRALPPLAVRETSGKADVAQLMAVGGPLKDATAAATGIMLSADPAPASVSAGRIGTVPLGLSDTPYPGLYTAQLVLRAPAMPDRTVDVTVRLHTTWSILLLVLALGVGLGWWVNVSLVGRAALDAARLAGLRVSASIAVRAGLQKDPAVQERLLETAQALETEMVGAAGIGEIQDAPAKSSARADAIETRAAQDALQFGADLDAATKKFAPDGSPIDPMLGAVLADLTERLDGIAGSGEAGDVENASRRLAEFDQSFDRKAVELLQAWALQVRAALKKFGEWPDPTLEPEKSRLMLDAEATAAYGQNDGAEAIRACNKLALALRGWAILQAPEDVARILRSAAKTIDGKFPDEARTLGAIADDTARDGASMNPLTALTALAAERQRALDLFDTWKAKPGLSDALGIGRAALLAVTPDGAAAAAAPPAPVSSPAARGPVAPGQAPRILLPIAISTRQTVAARVEWGTAEAPAAPTWSSSGSVTIVNGTIDRADIVANAPGYFTLGVADATGTRVSATRFAGDPARTPVLVRVGKDAARTNGIIGIVTGVVTILAGAVVFDGTWLGTPSDLFTAFAWGFFGNFGLERVTKLVAPVLNRTIPQSPAA